MTSLIYIFCPLQLFIDFIYRWQDFFGSLIGTSAAIIIFFLTSKFKDIEVNKNHLHLLHRSIGASISNLAETDKTVNLFADNQLSKMIEKVDSDIKSNIPSVCYGFVPLLHIFEISEELLRQPSRSGYVDILTIQLINISKDFRKIIDDLNRQFESIITLNNQIVLAGVNSNHNENTIQFKNNLIQFKSTIIKKDFQSFVRNYARLLIKSQVAVGKLSEWGIAKWKKKFQKIAPDKIEEDIDKYFNEEVQEKKVKFQDAFYTNLAYQDSI